MGREARKVPADWEHPKDEDTDRYIPLLPGEWYEAAAKRFLELVNTKGLQAALDEEGYAPDINDYMLVGVPDSERTHYMMYEDTTEGTPKSPAFETPEELARWLTDTEASYFGSMTATYEQWLYVAKGGWGGIAVTLPPEGTGELGPPDVTEGEPDDA